MCAYTHRHHISKDSRAVLLCKLIILVTGCTVHWYVRIYTIYWTVLHLCLYIYYALYINIYTHLHSVIIFDMTCCYLLPSRS